MTHTYAVLEVTPMAFAEIRKALEVAGYHPDEHEIDMHGIALAAKGAGPHPSNIEIGTLLSHRTKQGVVELCVNGERMQLDLDKAREVRGMLDGAIEAAVSDGLLFAFLTQRIGLSEVAASAALLDFRELRQGSRDTVYPS